MTVKELLRRQIENEQPINISMQAKRWQKDLNKQLARINAENQRLNEKSNNLSTVAKLIQETFHDELERMTPTQQEMIQQQTRRDMVQATRSEQELQREEAQVFGKEDDIANPIMPGTEITDNPAGVMQDQPYSARQGGPMGYRDEDDEEAVQALKNVVYALVNKNFPDATIQQAGRFSKEFEDILALVKQHYTEVATFSGTGTIKDVQNVISDALTTIKFKKSYGISYFGDVGLCSITKASDGFSYISGIVSDTGVDRDNERFSPSALLQMKSAIDNGMMLFANHDHNIENTLGVFTKSELLNNGNTLWAEARLEDASKNANVASLLNKLETGMTLGFSIGGDLLGEKKKEYDSKLGQQVGTINSLKLYEVSAVALPSNPRALITGVR